MDLLREITLTIFDTTKLLAGKNYQIKDCIDTPFLHIIKIKPKEISTKEFLSDKLRNDIKLVAQLERNEEVVIDVHKGFVTIQIPKPANERRNVLYYSSNVPRGSGLKVSLGLDIFNEPLYFDFSKQMNTTLSFLGVMGSGKSMSMRWSITSIARNNDHLSTKFLMIEVAKGGIDLKIFGNLAHLIHPVITNETEAEHALNWVIQEMNKGELPYTLFVCVDEVAALVNKRPDTADLLKAIVSQGRALGVKTLLATQLTDRDTLGDKGSAVFKQVHNNVLGKATSKQLSFALGSKSQLGAEALVGEGDLILNSNDGISRFAGVFTTDRDRQNLPIVERVNRLPLNGFTNTDAVKRDIKPEVKPGRPREDIPVEIVAEGLISIQKQLNDPEYYNKMQGRLLTTTDLKRLGRNTETFKSRDQEYIKSLYRQLHKQGAKLCGGK